MFFDQSYRAINARTCIKVHLLAQCKEILLISSMKWLCTFIKRNIVFYIIIVSHIHYFFLNVVFEILRTGVQNFVGVFSSKRWRVYPILSTKSQGYTKCAVDSSWIIQLLIYCHLVRRSTRLAVSSPEPRICRFIYQSLPKYMNYPCIIQFKLALYDLKTDFGQI